MVEFAEWTLHALRTVGVVVLTFAVGAVVHEHLHALPLRLTGEPYRIEWFPDPGDESRLLHFISGAAARVHFDSDAPRRVLGVAALMPLLMWTPVLLVPAGILPEPVMGAPLSPYFLVWGGWLSAGALSPADAHLVRRWLRPGPVAGE